MITLLHKFSKAKVDCEKFEKCGNSYYNTNGLQEETLLSFVDGPQRY
jgi:hypothetical protein